MRMSTGLPEGMPFLSNVRSPLPAALPGTGMASIAAAAKDRHTGIRNEEVSLKLGVAQATDFRKATCTSLAKRSILGWPVRMRWEEKPLLRRLSKRLAFVPTLAGFC